MAAKVSAPRPCGAMPSLGIWGDAGVTYDEYLIQWRSRGARGLAGADYRFLVYLA